MKPNNELFKYVNLYKFTDKQQAIINDFIKIVESRLMNPDDTDCCFTGYPMSLTVTPSGIGDCVCFTYLGYELHFCEDDTSWYLIKGRDGKVLENSDDNRT